ncbi:MAG TPA: carboxylesterase/lipase family protein [bacterium]|nr:carboxylesterase/lipase family protein [bacterium]
MNFRGLFTLIGFVAVLCFAGVAGADDSCSGPVETTLGLVRGISEAGEEACVWKGIPYAAAPVGEQRWKAPRAHPVWSGVREATAFGRQCMQVPGMLSDQELGFSEDCLYLNIWRPKKSGIFPVMFWIHGGGLSDGTASIPMYYGGKLAGQKDVVLVSINYRLGPFGFLALSGFADEDPRGSAGNYGLLDMVQALKWVRDNIANFGGDPGNVTIFGESAGARSVCNLIVCPLAKGLFHGAIIESGGCAARSMDECNADGAVFAGALGCEGPGAAACMRQKSADEIIDAVKKGARTGVAFADEKFEFKICVDGWSQKGEPLAVIGSGDYNNVPVMVGSNRDEFKLFALLSLPPYYRLLPSSRLDQISGDRFKPKEGSRDRYQELYPPGSFRRPADRWVAGVTDATYTCRGLQAADAIAARQPRTWYYRFDYDRHRFPHLLGVAHGLEIVYIFDTLEQKGIFNLYGKNQLQQAEPMVDIMMGYWTNFAKTGDPNGPDLPRWPAYNTQSRERMHLDLPPRAAPAQDTAEKCEFWARQNAGGW